MANAKYGGKNYLGNHHCRSDNRAWTNSLEATAIVAMDFDTFQIKREQGNGFSVLLEITRLRSE